MSELAIVMIAVGAGLIATGFAYAFARMIGEP